MKLQNVPLHDIADNPWRDKDLYPLDDDHVQELRESISDHDFFASLKGRRVNGKVEIACGHARVAAARKARLDTVPIYIADLDDDAMLRLMVEENALQGGNSPGAVLNEVAAIIRRLIQGLLYEPRDGSQTVIRKAFESKHDFDTMRDRLSRRASNSEAQVQFNRNVIVRYLGSQHRSENQLREAINALKQTGHFDRIVDEEIRKHPLPVEDAKPAKDTTVIKSRLKPRRPPSLNERVAASFKTETQFH